MSNAYKMEWDKQNTTQFKIKLNNNTDKDIIDWLDSLENKQGTIKEMIRRCYNTSAGALILTAEQLNQCKKNALELFDSGKLFELSAGSSDSLIEIHNAVFKDMPGLVVDSVQCGTFEAADALSQRSFNSVIEKYVAMNSAASFKGGKGISMRIWLDYLVAKEIRMLINWESIDANDYLLALDRSPIKDLEIKAVFKNAVGSGEYNREEFIKNLDLSFGYEGY